MRRAPWALSALGVTLVMLTVYGVASPRSVRSPEPRATGAVPGTVAEYPSMTALRKVEKADAYQIAIEITDSPLIVVAPHGGAIEIRTSEIAQAVAGTDHTQCHFQGRLPAGKNFPRLHVTSEHWDLEECLILIRQRTHALSVHGTKREGRTVFIGGRDTDTGARLATALRTAGFTVVQPAPADIAGTSPDNFVNKDSDGQGVQFELTADLRTDLFPTKDGPASACTATFRTCGQAFVDAVRGVYATT
ncbi:poly-gamma-glutamate hydrolase family protein [Jidongwangia harbinensis]|uniref:poly-gamma-glutamate hydrolase family protein n=1 Tax=Jidongwangia harbinensis TaxID=2878561 RepID=UPI001CD9BFBB|nr:poly-gamma-glutamate hydrolase family protein [Jidongwangia harbinensis]MCA2217157.1 poly-gamma-glutamate hydrolase family protein [Jidongwangia harbinensis]